LVKKIEPYRELLQGGNLPHQFCQASKFVNVGAFTQF